MTKLSAGFLLLFSIPAIAGHVPGHAKLEWGFGAALISTPDYIGSSYTQNIIAPFPYLKYRGEHLRIDEGIEARLLNTPDLILSISGNGSLSTPDDNPTRKGMDKLDASFELGPSLEYRLTHDDSTSIWLEIPLRFAYSLGGNNGFIGQVFNPKITWRKPAQHKFDWKLRAAIGPLFGDEDYNGYYYDVAEHEITAQRAAFKSTSGYSGFRTEFTYSRRIDRVWFGGFIRYDNISNSVIEDSPLVMQSNNLSAGIALAWVFSDHGCCKD